MSTLKDMNPSDSQANQGFLKELAHKNNIDLLGIADIKGKNIHSRGLPRELLSQLPLAIVIGVRVSPTVLTTLKDGPNLIYFHHYRQLNFLLDRAALRISHEIERKGYLALPIPASQIVDRREQVGHVSHKELAWLSGLGWRGRNNLLVTDQWGAQVRLSSTLTNFPLEPGHPIQKDCRACKRCLDICPAKAIKEEASSFDCFACYQKLKEFNQTRDIGQYICGLCVKACSGSSSK